MQSLSAISLDDYIGFVNIAIVPFAVIEIGILYPVVPLDREQAISESPGIEYAVQHAVTEHTVFTCLSVVAHFATTTGLVLVDELKLLRLGIDGLLVSVLKANGKLNILPRVFLFVLFVTHRSISYNLKYATLAYWLFADTAFFRIINIVQYFLYIFQSDRISIIGYHLSFL